MGWDESSASGQAEKTTAKLTKVPIGFPEDLYEWLREAAFKRRTSMADIVREALREHQERSVQQMPLPMDDGR
ncbi:MAG: ribbon-helix-helix domain-containing protein [Actinomycetota bacterium]|nr:ribbon-helix-helix domain-containing protein [Actinomycetota bacterium]